MGDIVRGTAVNLINFLNAEYKGYLKTGKTTRRDKAVRRLNKFLNTYPNMQKFVFEELTKLNIPINILGDKL